MSALLKPGVAVTYVGDPERRTLTVVQPAGGGWWWVEWPRGQGRGREDHPWKHWGAQLVVVE